MSIIYNKANSKKKYSVGGRGIPFAYTDTIAEAKSAGSVIAKKVAWRGKWNLMFLSLPIFVADAPGSVFYKQTGWVMYVPVRGTGVQAERIIDEIKRRHGVAPLVWVKKAR